MSRRETNLDRFEEAHNIFAETAEECLVPGWFGELAVKLTIEDGVIQSTQTSTTRKAIPRPSNARHP